MVQDVVAYVILAVRHRPSAQPPVIPGGRDARRVHVHVVRLPPVMWRFSDRQRDELPQSNPGVVCRATVFTMRGRACGRSATANVRYFARAISASKALTHALACASFDSWRSARSSVTH